MRKSVAKPPVMNESVMVRCESDLRQRLQNVADALSVPVARVARAAVEREVIRLERELAKEPDNLARAAIVANMIFCRGRS